MVITTPNMAPGFRLAGVETFAAESPDEAQRVLRELLEGDEASLIAVRQNLLGSIDSRLQRQIETSYSPLVMMIPGGTPASPGEGRRRYIAELIRRAVGFHITFGPREGREKA
jgi:V/A-type H+-transporting ATPase subunit F